MRLTRKQISALMDLLSGYWTEKVGETWAWIPRTKPLDALVEKRLVSRKSWPGGITLNGKAAYYPTQLGKRWAKGLRLPLYFLGRCESLAKDARRMLTDEGGPAGGDGVE